MKYQFGLVVVAPIAIPVCACSAATSPSAAPIENVRLLSEKYGDSLLEQCSRPAPAKGERYFKPDWRQVRTFETALQRRLETDGYFDRENAERRQYGLAPVSDIGVNWGRDVIGINRFGKQTLYANYYPLETIAADQVQDDQPVIVCDGGAQFFGAEFDLKSGEILSVAFNGQV